jgi:dTDP-4-dehydrorhamnose reductase
VNRDGARNVALGCRETGTKLIHISTDYVFDGRKGEPYTENEVSHPINIYGQSKLEGEREILRLQTSDSRLQTLIVRTSWLFGKNGRNFVDTILRLSGERDELRVVDDQVGSPTYTVDLSEAIERLIDRGATGIVHCSNSGECSWYLFAREILRLKGKGGLSIIPIKSDELKRPAPRPPYSVLSNERYYNLTGYRMRSWEESLGDYLTS